MGLGGAERLLASAAPHLDRARFDYEAVFLLPWKTALVSTLIAAGVPTTCVPHPWPLDPRVVGNLARFIRKRNVDLVHAHLPYTGIVGRLAARLAGIPLVYTEHNLQERYHPATRLANQWTLRMNSWTIAVSDEVRDSLRRSRLAQDVIVETVLNGVDVEALHREAHRNPDVRDELGIPQESPVVGVVSTFRAQKRLDLWLSAAQRIAASCPAARFIIVGDGPSRRSLEDSARTMGLTDRITFTGLRDDAPGLIASFDVFMLSSIFEGLPVSVLEAMALGCPVVATRVGGLPSVIEDGVQGYLVPAEAPELLADRVVALLSDRPERLAFGVAAARRVDEQFSISRMVDKTEAIYGEVLHNGH